MSDCGGSIGGGGSPGGSIGSINNCDPIGGTTTKHNYNHSTSCGSTTNTTDHNRQSSAVIQEINDDDHHTSNKTNSPTTFRETLDLGCFQVISDIIDPLTPGTETEFDEFLAMPDTVTVCSIGGEPVLVEDSTKINDDVDNIHIDVDGDNIIPFSSIHHPPLKFKSLQRKIFIPGVEIKVRIIDNERSATTHLLNPNLYTIQFQHGEFTWTVKKRYKHIQHLHQQLRIFRASLNIPFPTKTHREKRTSFKNNAPPPVKKGKRKGALPRFPSKPEALVSYEQLEERIKQLEDYLYNLLNISIYRNHPETIHFLQVSHISFIRGLGSKGKEGEVLKKTRSTQPGQVGCNFCGLLESSFCVRCNYFWSDILCSSWRKRWFFIKDTFFGYVRPKDGIIKCVILYDQGFEVSSGMYSTGLSNALQIQTLSRQLYIKSWTRRKCKEWMNYLRETAHTKAKDFTQTNMYSSFVPARTNMSASWFVDGASYMSAVADALEAAKEEIFIADWWLSPEIYMKRPVLSGDYWRLDKILQRKANEGVKIFILLYKEVEMALGINSFYSKQKLVNENSENIKVLRHPDHAKVGVFLWAHHEKIVVVDQTYAFLGGIDLCYGRWDDHLHRLIDLGSVSQYLPGRKKKTSSTPSGDHNYPASLLPLATASQDIGMSVVYDEEESPQDSRRNSTASDDSSNSSEPPLPVLQPGDNLLMPSNMKGKMNIDVYPGDNLLSPGNISERMKCNTPEPQKKNTLDKLKSNVKSKTKDFIYKLSSPDNQDSSKSAGQDIQKQQLEQKQSIHEDITDLAGSAKWWIGKDYVNFIVKDFRELELPFIDLVDRQTTPRMPWHDVGVAVYGAAARDVSRHFIQRWNATKLEKARLNPIYPYLLPKTYNDCERYPNILTESPHKVTCQVLRSVSSWSAGFIDYETVEQSIHEAYIDSINRAQNFIYIENQFFISLSMKSIHVRNLIAEALYKRIKRAHREQAKFRVYVVMPLLPGFEGEVGGATGTALHAVTHWNYASISRGQESLLSRLYELGIKDPSEYISFYSLRTHAELQKEPVSELIYVHSKLMIVDDFIAICGSANINDRSMLGKRDSEIAVYIKDESYDSGQINGQSFPSGKFVGSLRKHLFKEHLGLLEDPSDRIDVTDPVADSFYRDIWMKTAEKNTEIFESVFQCIPTDQVSDFEKLKAFQEKEPISRSHPSKARKMLEGIRGHLVKLPLDFLCNETLTPTARTVEGMMPTSLWT